jgi:hypothetical protein
LGKRFTLDEEFRKDDCERSDIIWMRPNFGNEIAVRFGGKGKPVDLTDYAIVKDR